MQIGFLGAGNMGGAILHGYCNARKDDNIKLGVFGVNIPKLHKTAEETGATAYTDISKLVDESNIIFIGVKPQKFEEVMPQIAQTYTKGKICVSMVAGISISYIEKFLGEEAKIIRIMPNTPAKVNLAMTSVSPNCNVQEKELDVVLEVLNAIGKTKVVDENLIHTVIGVSGSAPAYVYMFIDALIQTAIKQGMTEKDAKVFASQTVKGAAEMVLDSDETPQKLKENVCSKGGTTIEAVNVLENGGFYELIEKAFVAASDKSRILEK